MPSATADRTLDPFFVPTFDLSLLLPLLAAHFLSDFALQGDRMAKSKNRPGTLLLHLLVTALCAYALLGDFREWRIPLLVTATHGLIDLAKLRLARRPRNDLPAFVGDQLAHLLVIFAVSAIHWPASGLIEPWWKEQNPASYLSALAFLAGGIATTKASGIFISKALPRMLEADPLQLQADSGLNRAGRYIGYLERLLLLAFTLTGQLAAVGFLIAAKSIFRFPAAQAERRQAEYFLLGTLLSFALGIGIALATEALLPR